MKDYSINWYLLQKHLNDCWDHGAAFGLEEVFKNTGISKETLNMYTLNLSKYPRTGAKAIAFDLGGTGNIANLFHPFLDKENKNIFINEVEYALSEED